jgi:hypothetical protein
MVKILKSRNVIPAPSQAGHRPARVGRHRDHGRRHAAFRAMPYRASAAFIRLSFSRNGLS